MYATLKSRVHARVWYEINDVKIELFGGYQLQDFQVYVLFVCLFAGFPFMIQPSPGYYI